MFIRELLITATLYISTKASALSRNHIVCEVTLSESLKAAACSSKEIAEYVVPKQPGLQTAELYATLHENHIETPTPLSKDLIRRIKHALDKCKHQNGSVCDLHVPQKVSLVKFHMAELENGEFEVIGVYLRQRNLLSNSEVKHLKIGFRIQRNKKLSKRQVVMGKKKISLPSPSNIFERLFTTPKGLVVIGVIKVTKRPPTGTYSLGVITSYTTPPPTQARIKRILLHTTADKKKISLKQLLGDVSKTFDMVQTHI